MHLKTDTLAERTGVQLVIKNVLYGGNAVQNVDYCNAVANKNKCPPLNIKWLTLSHLRPFVLFGWW